MAVEIWRWPCNGVYGCVFSVLPYVYWPQAPQYTTVWTCTIYTASSTSSASSWFSFAASQCCNITYSLFSLFLLQSLCATRAQVTAWRCLFMISLSCFDTTPLVMSQDGWFCLGRYPQMCVNLKTGSGTESSHPHTFTHPLFTLSKSTRCFVWHIYVYCEATNLLWLFRPYVCVWVDYA